MWEGWTYQWQSGKCAKYEGGEQRGTEVKGDVGPEKSGGQKSKNLQELKHGQWQLLEKFNQKNDNEIRQQPWDCHKRKFFQNGKIDRT